MEEVDNIIMHSLRQIGCDIDEDISSLSQFSSELVVEAAVRCLEIIQPGRDLPLVLPANMAFRFRVTAAVADACSELGYRGDIGYQTFLYSNETDIRRVLMFLIERLPKESDKNANCAPADRISLLEHKIAQVVSEQMKAPWLPLYCKKNGIRKERIEGQSGRTSKTIPISIPHTQALDVSQDLREYWVHTLPTVPEQCGETLLPSVIAHNALEIVRQQNDVYKPNYSLILQLKRIDNIQLPILSNKTSIEQSLSVREQEESQSADPVVEVNKPALKLTHIEQLVCDSDSIKLEIEQLNTEMINLREQVESLKEETVNDQKAAELAVEQRKLISRSHSLLQNSDENVDKLTIMAEATSVRLVKLSEQWDEHKKIWTEKYRDTRLAASNKLSESQKAADNVITLKEKHKDLIEQINLKSAQHEQLNKEYESTSKNVNRSAYTRRIMEIIGNISKQKADLERILNDTKDIQKEINTLSGRLERSFTVADELIFKDAKKDDYSRRAYKFLATLHSDCSHLVSTVEATGAAIRETRDLEEQLQTEQSKKVSESFQRVTNDLQSMRQDSVQIAKKIHEKIQV